jgi:hypothetical protein
MGMAMKKVSLVLNTDDPEQAELHRFITKLPNGKKRNSSAFLKTLVDREYQSKRDSYLAEVRKKSVPTIKIQPESGEVKFRVD